MLRKKGNFQLTQEILCAKYIVKVKKNKKMITTVLTMTMIMVLYFLHITVFKVVNNLIIL